jgi:cell division septum initiation protein DivIVA
MGSSRRLGVGLLLVVVATLTLVGCGGDDRPSSLSEQLARYTDSGDGCQQVVSAISYADTSLKPAGQERYVTWTDEVRSKISAVSGTIALEVKDFPSTQALDQAQRTARLADRTAAAGVPTARRVRLLQEYRREAAQMVIVCARLTKHS